MVSSASIESGSLQTRTPCEAALTVELELLEPALDLCASKLFSVGKCQIVGNLVLTYRPPHRNRSRATMITRLPYLTSFAYCKVFPTSSTCTRDPSQICLRLRATPFHILLPTTPEARTPDMHTYHSAPLPISRPSLVKYRPQSRSSVKYM